ncbi:hypothetical protein HNQ64_001635 [Prosthecobacter dejongeii]|uniref:Uncharacterized protein n=1 Tax=Prosthecobacter dejongeii TaxID=48465 RepID=A0A7W7YJL2_9BACT|nr:hypothetical protein [Prosthecobacter dejongeii]
MNTYPRPNQHRDRNKFRSFRLVCPPLLLPPPIS